MKKDDLNIRELYEGILNKYAEANGVVILEHLKIPTKNSSPDKSNFDGVALEHDDANSKTLCFIGEDSELLAYSDYTHPTIFGSFIKLSAALGIMNFPATLMYMKSMFDNFKPSQSKALLKKDGVGFHGKLNKDNLSYFAEHQRDGVMGQMRINTRSGRLWTNVQSKSSNKQVSVIVFWCREKHLKPDDIKSIKKHFNLGDIFWSASDSKNFNAYTDDHRDTPSGETKELKSKIFPNLSHDEIVDILMRAHTGYRISPSEKKVVWEFRGFDPSDIKPITGGYDTPAEFHYRSKFSESTENNQ